MVLGGRGDGLGGGDGSELGGGLGGEAFGVYVGTAYVCRVWVGDGYDVSLKRVKAEAIICDVLVLAAECLAVIIFIKFTEPRAHTSSITSTMFLDSNCSHLILLLTKLRPRSPFLPHFPSLGPLLLCCPFFFF